MVRPTTNTDDPSGVSPTVLFHFMDSCSHIDLTFKEASEEQGILQDHDAETHKKIQAVDIIGCNLKEHRNTRGGLLRVALLHNVIRIVTSKKRLRTHSIDYICIFTINKVRQQQLSRGSLPVGSRCLREEANVVYRSSLESFDPKHRLQLPSGLQFPR